MNEASYHAANARILHKHVLNYTAAASRLRNGGDHEGSSRALDAARTYKTRRDIHEARAGKGYKREEQTHDEESVSRIAHSFRTPGHKGKLDRFKELHGKVRGMFTEARTQLAGS